MIINGRSGNQLFQYAFARSIQEKTGGELILDFSEMGFNRSQGKYGPDVHMDNVLDYFNVKPYTYVDVGTPYNRNITQKIQYFFYRVLRKVYNSHPDKVERIATATSGILQRFGIYYQFSTNSLLGYRQPSRAMKNILIRGWFESAEYFDSIKDLLREELKITHPVFTGIEDLRRRLKMEDSVCVHVRRGDFVSDSYKNEFQICSPDYYSKGVSIIAEKHPNLLLFVCSDDIEWCKANMFKGYNVLYEPAGLPISDTISLMSTCHHFVISNSTLSFWMQYLSNCPDKMVIAPSVWRRIVPPVKDIYMKEWILVDCK